jgi:hypothetical protein
MTADWLDTLSMTCCPPLIIAGFLALMFGLLAFVIGPDERGSIESVGTVILSDPDPWEYIGSRGRGWGTGWGEPTSPSPPPAGQPLSHRLTPRSLPVISDSTPTGTCRSEGPCALSPQQELQALQDYMDWYLSQPHCPGKDCEHPDCDRCPLGAGT